MSIALKVFCVGITFGGASGLAPLIPVTKSGSNSSLVNDAARQIKREIKEGGKICWGYSNAEETAYGKRLEGTDVRFVFWIGNEGECPKFGSSKKEKKIGYNEAKKNDYWSVEVTRGEYKQIIDRVKRNEECKRGCEDHVEFLRDSLNSGKEIETLANYLTALRLMIETLIKEQIGDWTWVVNK